MLEGLSWCNSVLSLLINNKNSVGSSTGINSNLTIMYPAN